MTLEEQNHLINDLIRENPDTTIKDFLDLKTEISGIAAITPKPTIEEAIIAVEVVVNKEKRRRRDQERKYGQTYKFRL